MSIIEASVVGRGYFLRRPRPRFTVRGLFSKGYSIGYSTGYSAGCSAGCSAGYSSLILLSDSDSKVGSIRKYGFTVVDLKSVGPLSSYTLQVSLSRSKRVYRPVYLLLRPILPSR
jgi:hypothetical protein